jgi:hypothetical protein
MAAMKAARVYAARGLPVVPLHDVSAGRCSCNRDPCPSAGKHPRILEWEKEATTDLERVESWIARWPNANLGVATGAEFWALDIDPGKGGSESLAALIAEHGELPATPEQITGSGGRHYLFKAVAGLTNTAGRIGRGLDSRGERGQIVVSPSRSLKGVYRWVAGRAPWEIELADAPAWLLERLRKTDAGAGILHPITPTDRGYFPPANAEELELARSALEAHGPAVQGEGGDDHTFRATAKMMHDFALTEDEAWPLLLEWNETCRPPWPESDLRAKLRGGTKYGTAQFGRMRWLSAPARVTKLITDWRTAGQDEEKILPLVQAAREVCAAGVDPITRQRIETDLIGATSMKARALDLPKTPPPGKPRPPKPGEITITPNLAETADAAFKAIRGDVYARNGTLCEVVSPDRTFIEELQPARIQDLMARRAEWVRPSEDGGEIVEQQAPLNVAVILAARREHTGVRPLDAVTTAPIFLADGSILQTRGYNAEARVYLEPSVTVDVPDRPTLKEARAAARMLCDLVGQFSFRDAADRTSWLAALLSPLVKTATGNAPTPLICISASTPGAGKSLLADLISQIVTGEKAELSPYNPKDPAEWGKRLTSFVKAGSPVRVLDNCNGPIGDEALDRLITSSRWSDRILGASEAPPLPNVTTWLATGNNIEPTGDTVRRVLMCRINVDTDRPQERQGFDLDLEGGYAVEHRSELLGAALTILRAWHVADRPTKGLASWGSFTGWSAVVRAAIVWLGMVDPYLTQRRATAEFNETDNIAHDFWLGVIDGAADGFAKTIADAANQLQASDVLGLRTQINPHGVRGLVARFVDKPRDGRRIRRELDGRNQQRYFVERIP